MPPPLGKTPNDAPATTGPPKGVLLSHDCLLFTGASAVRRIGLRPWGVEVFVSYLPLSHIAAQILDMYMMMIVAAEVCFARPDALRSKGSLNETLRQVRPTAFFGVPRVFEKLQEAMQEKGREASRLKRCVAQWAKSIGLKGNRALIEG